MPEVKIRKAVRALWAHSARTSALLRSNLRDSHFQTDGIATDVFWVQIYTFSVLATKKVLFCSKTAALLPRGKGKGKDNNGIGTFRYLFICLVVFSPLANPYSR